MKILYQQQTTNNKQHNNGLNFKKLVLCTALLAGLSISATAKTYVITCNWTGTGNEETTCGSDSEPMVNDTKLEPLSTNTYELCCADSHNDCDQPNSADINTSHNILAVDEVHYCGNAGETGGIKFNVTNTDPLSGNTGFNINTITCTGNNNNYNNVLQHDGFSSASAFGTQPGC